MLKLYNTLTKKLEEFKPIKKGEVSFYHCGPTVYWTQHIGNLRGMMMADLIRRALEYLSYKVKFVRNYTDVGHLISDADLGEDKMEKGARREGLSPDQIADKYIKIFEQDTQALNIEEPTVKPRATEYVRQMIDMIEILKEKGFAYETKQAVYFDVSKYPDYNKLNRQNLERNQEGAGTGDISDPDKKNSYDFALWIFKTGVHENALQTWKSPFHSSVAENGRGFPGWHIECSAMSKVLLGETIDLHMGGIEHIPVHHTNEIAQSEAANGVKFVNYWLHNEHLTVNGRKMAKSEGTGYSLREIIAKGFTPLDLRYFFLNSHYRSKQNFTWEALKDASISHKNLKDKIWKLSSPKGEIISKYQQKFKESLENDFNIPQALALAWDLLKSDEKQEDIKKTLLDFDKVLGLKLHMVSGAKNEPLSREKIQKSGFEDIVRDYEEARRNKDYLKSDNLREEIEGKGYRLEDTKEGTKVYQK